MIETPDLLHYEKLFLKRRAARAGLAGRVEARHVGPETLGVDDLAGSVNFTLAYAVVHEMPDAARFFKEAAAALKQGASLLLAEPSGHVKPAEFEEELALAARAGLEVVERPSIRRSHAAVLKKV